MTISSRTPEGQSNHCPVCDSKVNIEPSQLQGNLPFGDAPCSSCGHLLWFTWGRDGVLFYDLATAEPKKKRVREIIAERLGVSLDKVPDQPYELREFISKLGADSLDVVELIMELEEEFDILGE